MTDLATIGDLTDALGTHGTILFVAAITASLVRLVIVVVAFERAASRGYPTGTLPEILRIALGANEGKRPTSKQLDAPDSEG